MDFVLDFGNARIKWFEPRANAYNDCRHAIYQMKESEWQKVVGRGRSPEGYARVNGVPYAIGDTARRYQPSERPRGASRYVDTYYGVALGYALAEGFQRSIRNVTLFASHAPADIQYSRNLVNAASGRWTVENRFGVLEFNVQSVQTFDEPLGGYTHFVFTEKGVERKKNPLANATTLVVDVGGYTVDVAAVDPGGEIDLMSLQSTRTGVLHLTKSFEEELRANNATMFLGTGDIDARKIENAILTKEYVFGRQTINCQQESDAAINGLASDVMQVINAAGGVANYEVMLVTGGGAALIYEALEQALPRALFLMAEPQRPLMKYANVFGGGKLAALLRNTGVL